MESRADLAMLFMAFFHTTTSSTRRVTPVRPEKGPRETALEIQGSTTMFLYALEIDIAITIEKQYESFEKLGLLFLYQGQKSSSKVRYLHTYLTSYLPTYISIVGPTSSTTYLSGLPYPNVYFLRRDGRPATESSCKTGRRPNSTYHEWMA